MTTGEEPVEAESDGQARLGHRLISFFEQRIPRAPSPTGLIRMVSWAGSHFLFLTFAPALLVTGVVMILNAESRSLLTNDVHPALAVLFAALLLAYNVTQKLYFLHVTTAIEIALHERRTALCERLLRVGLSELNSIPLTTVVNALAKNFETITYSLVPLLRGFQSAITLAIMMGYLFWQSVPAGLTAIFFVGFLVQSYAMRSRDLREKLKNESAADNELSVMPEEIFRGLKELKLDPLKEEALAADINARSRQVADFRGQTSALIGAIIADLNSATYLFAATIIFVLPIVSSATGPEFSRILTTVLFLLGPLVAVIGAIQQWATAQAAFGGIQEFEARLSQTGETLPKGKPPAKFESLVLDHVSYSYSDCNGERGFEVKSVNLELRPGEVVFITGGNGSGKTTAMRVITGLYPAQGGSIQLNGESLRPADLAGYRLNFSAVFADFHVFRKPYGLDDAQIARLDRQLELFGIRDKLPPDLRSGFDPRSLSTGQRKRLALALAMVEDRPVLVLDEWAADQDPEYRERFYRQIVPDLKAQGRAILLVSHDDRYFDTADRRYRMVDNCLRRVS